MQLFKQLRCIAASIRLPRIFLQAKFVVVYQPNFRVYCEYPEASSDDPVMNVSCVVFASQSHHWDIHCAESDQAWLAFLAIPK